MKFLNQNRLVLILSTVIILLFLFNLRQCNAAKVADKKIEVAAQNIKALQDTLRFTKAKDGTIEADKLALLTDKVSNLEKLNADLAKAVKNTQGKVSTIITGGVQIVHDTVPLIVKSEIFDSSVISNFNFDKNYSKGNSRTLQGFTKYNLRTGTSSGTLIKDSLNIAFVTGIKDLDKGRPTIFLRSDYPGFTTISLEGAVLDPFLFKPKNSQKLITMGASIGYIPLTYDLSTKKTDLSFTRLGVSLGVNINLLKLITHK